MRGIKYRAWDKINKKWIKHFNIDLLNIDVSELPNIEIMQYTGLKDKNRKEIYEGDIVEVDATTTTDWEKHRFKIVNIQGAFCITNDIWQEISSFLNNSICDDVMSLFELWWHNTEDTNDNDLTFVEVIGNIYENPELLEEGN